MSITKIVMVIGLSLLTGCSVFTPNKTTEDPSYSVPLYNGDVPEWVE